MQKSKEERIKEEEARKEEAKENAKAEGIKPMKTVNEDIMSKFESLDGEEVLF